MPKAIASPVSGDRTRSGSSTQAVPLCQPERLLAKRGQPMNRPIRISASIAIAEAHHEPGAVEQQMFVQEARGAEDARQRAGARQPLARCSRQRDAKGAASTADGERAIVAAVGKGLGLAGGIVLGECRFNSCDRKGAGLRGGDC